MLPEFTRRGALRLLGVANAAGLGSLTSSLAAATPSTSEWTQLTKLVAEDGDSGDAFGTSVALDGDTAVVGANGSAYVFAETGGSWSQRTKLVADDEDGSEHGDFGHSVALDEGTALIGARYDDNEDAVERQLTELGYNQHIPGSAYVFTRSDGSWTQEAELVATDRDTRDRFGQSVAIDGDTALVGADWDEDPNGEDAGSAYVFSRSDGEWTQQVKLTAGDEGPGAFGWSVALDGDTAVVGARWRKPGGAAYVFTRSDGGWTRVAKLTATDRDPEDHFGSSVALDGDTAVIGAHSDESSDGSETGSAYVFARSGSSWTREAKLTADDGDEQDSFGSSVAVHGSTVLVGASSDEDPNGRVAGSAYVFTRSDGEWSQRTKLAADDGDGGDRFGTSASLENGTAFIGAADDEDPLGYGAGSMYVYWKDQREVRIDIDPSDGSNSINPDAKGVVPVAVVHTDDFDPAARIDVSSLRFGAPDVVDNGGGATPAHGGHVEDVTGDGADDLVLHFPIEETGFGDGGTAGKLVGETDGGVAVFGTDTVRSVGDRGRGPDNSPSTS